MKDKLFYKKLLSLALPLTFQNLMLACVAVADAFMLGTLDQNSMSGVSLATQFQFVQNTLMFALVLGITTLGAQYYGKGDKDSINEIFCIGLKITAGFSFIFFVGCVFFPGALMKIFTNEPALQEIGVRYLKIAGWSYLLTGFSQSYLSCFKVVEHASMAALISTCGVIINIILNAIFIYGLFGIPSLGVEGAAIATLIARIIELVWAIALSYKKSYIHPQISKLIKSNKLLCGDFIKCTWPVVSACTLWSVGFASFTAFIGHLGVDAAAANSVASVIRDLVCCLCSGMANGAVIMIGYELGAGNLERGKQFGEKFMRLSFVCGIASTILMLAFTPILLSLVKLTEGARDCLLGMMLIMSFYMIGRAVNTIVINGVLDAGGDTKYDMYSLIAVTWCLAVPLAALGTFVFHWPVLVVYACTCLDEVGKIPWTIYHFKKYLWVRNMTR